MPETVLSHISSRQPNVTSVSIITGVNCEVNRVNPLDPFESLRVAQLRKIFVLANVGTEMYSICELLRRNAQLLEEIQIDADPMGKDNRFTYRFLELEENEELNLFPFLRKLSLSIMHWELAEVDLIAAFNFSQLRSLKLQDCNGTNNLLAMLAKSSTPIQLMSFELNSTGVYMEQYSVDQPLMKFLKSFQGLKDLCIRRPINRGMGEDEKLVSFHKYWESVLHHRSTLERVVNQYINLAPEADSFLEENILIHDLLLGANLKCLRVLCDPTDLFSSLSQNTSRPNIKFLYINSPGLGNGDITLYRKKYLNKLPKVHKFAEWAFGPDGIRELEVLAYGDFSNKDRHPNLLLCRSQGEPGGDAETTYRAVTKKDVRAREMIQDNFDFLEACPNERLMHAWGSRDHF